MPKQDKYEIQVEVRVSVYKRDAGFSRDDLVCINLANNAEVSNFSLAGLFLHQLIDVTKEEADDQLKNVAQNDETNLATTPTPQPPKLSEDF